MQSALLQLPGLEGPDLFSTISGWPSPNFSVLLNWPAVGCHMAWEGGSCLLVPFLQCCMVLGFRTPGYKLCVCARVRACMRVC